MAEIKLAAEVRTEFGKGAARQTRRANKVPGVIYGHGADPVHVTLPGHELMMALKTSNALLRLDVDGKSELVIPKAVQRDAIKRTITHVTCSRSSWARRSRSRSPSTPRASWPRAATCSRTC